MKYSALSGGLAVCQGELNVILIMRLYLRQLQRVQHRSTFLARSVRHPYIALAYLVRNVRSSRGSALFHIAKPSIMSGHDNTSIAPKLTSTYAERIQAPAFCLLCGGCRVEHLGCPVSCMMCCVERLLTYVIASLLYRY